MEIVSDDDYDEDSLFDAVLNVCQESSSDSSGDDEEEETDVPFVWGGLGAGKGFKHRAPTCFLFSPVVAGFLGTNTRLHTPLLQAFLQTSNQVV